MPKRHGMRAGDWGSVFGRLQELVLANSGEDDFEEIFKLVLAKFCAESSPAGRRQFRVGTTAAATARAFNRLLARAAGRWDGVLPGPPVSRLSDDHLTACVAALQDHGLLDANLEALDGAFERLVQRTAKGSKGQYFTPRHVIDCCVKIIDPGPKETVLDPACGSAGFLVHALNHVRGRGHEASRYSASRLFGCDFDGRAVRVARALLQIAADGPANVFRLNSLLLPGGGTRPTVEEAVGPCGEGGGADVILTNPPFAGEVREADLLRGYELARAGRRVERDVLFLERCVRLLRPGGRLAIVLPHNKLASAAWAYVRAWLVRRVRVVAVLGLGRTTFLPHTHQKAAVLFGVKRRRPAGTPGGEDVLFLISERPGKDSRGEVVPRPGSRPGQPAWERADHDLAEVVERFHDFRKAGKVSWEE